MVAAIAAVFVITLIAIVAFVVVVRGEVSEITRVEKRLLDPRTPTVVYAVPNGVDPADLIAGLRQEGFASVVDFVGDDEVLRVECEPESRERVRSLIEHAHLTGYDGGDLRLGHVAFVDER